MKQIEYVATFKEHKDGGVRTAEVILGDYKDWNEVLSCDILWGNINFSWGDTTTLCKSPNFPTDTDDVTFFDKEKHWTFVRVLRLIKRETIVTSQIIWNGNK